MIGDNELSLRESCFPRVFSLDNSQVSTFRYALASADDRRAVGECTKFEDVTKCN